MSLEPWKLLDEESVIKNKWFELVDRHYRLPGEMGERGYLILKESSGAIIVPKTQDGRYVVVRQYRAPLDKIVYDFPAGRWEESDSGSLDLARRELEEETGYVSDEWYETGPINPMPNRAEKTDYALLALNVRLEGAQNFDENEQIEVELVTKDQLHALIREGNFNCGTCLSALYRAQLKEEELGLF